jgi:hypothetical protein
MKRPRFSARERTSRDAVELGKLATGLANSGSKLEDSFWEGRLAAHIDRMLESHAEDDLTQALDRLFEGDPRAHDELADMIESRAETMRLAGEGQPGGWDILLVAAPILATSRFGISAGTIPKATLAALTAQLSAHQIAKDARLALADYLFSPDQLPRTFCDTHAFLRELGDSAISGKPVKIDAKSMPETNKFLSDVRYLVGAVAVPAGGAIFRWNESDCTRETALAAWVDQGAPNVEPLLTGSTFQLLSLDAYHSACRTADRDARPYSVKASVAFLSVVTGLEPDKMRAVIGPFYDRRLEEFRISLGPADSDEVYHGVVWPLLGAEDEVSDVVSQIEEVLRECGLTRIDSLDNRFPFEFCDECGVPLYPNAEGETVHAELPEQAAQSPQVLH